MTKVKFGIIDIALSAVAVAGIGLNVYGFVFREGGAEVKPSPSPAVA